LGHDWNEPGPEQSNDQRATETDVFHGTKVVGRLCCINQDDTRSGYAATGNA
jgi:hypothetical protein